MREIKFRAWGKKERLYLPILEINAFNWYVRTYDNKYPAQEIELEQFTGLYDKNGNEIHEGDIVEIIVEHNVYYPSKDAPKFTPIKKVCPVKVRPGIMTVGKWILCEFKQDKIQVIGNIHENPELLEEQ